MFDTLYRLSAKTFPVTISDRRQIENLRRLEAAGYIRVHIPCVHVDCDDCIRQDPATVLGITQAGRSILRRGGCSGGNSTMHGVQAFSCESHMAPRPAVRDLRGPREPR